MDSDDLATVKALRKAKKKEIQAWITAFEEREGRSPEARCAYCRSVHGTYTQLAGCSAIRSLECVQYPRTGAYSGLCTIPAASLDESSYIRVRHSEESYSAPFLTTNVT